MSALFPNYYNATVAGCGSVTLPDATVAWYGGSTIRVELKALVSDFAREVDELVKAVETELERRQAQMRMWSRMAVSKMRRAPEAPKLTSGLEQPRPRFATRTASGASRWRVMQP